MCGDEEKHTHAVECLCVCMYTSALNHDSGMCLLVQMCDAFVMCVFVRYVCMVSVCPRVCVRHGTCSK